MPRQIWRLQHSARNKRGPSFEKFVYTYFAVSDLRAIKAKTFNALCAFGRKGMPCRCSLFAIHVQKEIKCFSRIIQLCTVDRGSHGCGWTLSHDSDPDCFRNQFCALEYKEATKQRISKLLQSVTSPVPPVGKVIVNVCRRAATSLHSC